MVTLKQHYLPGLHIMCMYICKQTHHSTTPHTQNMYTSIVYHIRTTGTRDT